MRSLIACATCFAALSFSYCPPAASQSPSQFSAPLQAETPYQQQVPFPHQDPFQPQLPFLPRLPLQPEAFGQVPTTPPGANNLQLYEGSVPGDVTLHADRAPLTEVLKLIARKHNLNLVAGPGLNGEVTLSLENAHLSEVLDAIVGVSGHRWHRSGNLLYITGMNSEQKLGASVQGRILRVFPLNFVASADILPVATGLLTPIGQAFATESDAMDKSKTNELLVVEDIPEAVQRVESYVLQVDQPPRQVLIEVHILQVVLNDLLRHGVNLRPMTRLGSGSVTFETLGLANTQATQGLKMSLEGSDITGLVELIQTNSNSRTLASPKLLVANRQTSNIQIGKRLSYLTTTTTQTAAVQSVQFLETGVVVQVTPTISADNQVLLQISPKVSGGQLNAATNLPEEESTELSTTVLLPDGGGVIMGGLIKDEDLENVSEIPGLCRIPVLGHLFRRREVSTIRTEVIIAMVTHIIPSVDQIRQHELCELQNNLPPYALQELRTPQPVADLMQPQHFIAPSSILQPSPNPTFDIAPLPTPVSSASIELAPPANITPPANNATTRRLPAIR